MRLNVKNIFGAGLIALAFSVGTAKIASAQSCTVPPTCDALGYTKTATDCKDMSTLKCPFDQSKVFCVTAAEAGTGNCEYPDIGYILYSDKSCSASYYSTKTPIGIIFDKLNRLAISLNSTSKVWSTEYFDIPNLTNQSSSEALAAWNGKSNTKTIIDYCKANSKSCPAAEYAYSFTTVGTKAGDWYLPSLGELNAIYTNKTTLNSMLSRVGGTNLPDSYHWSSSESNSYGAWSQNLSSGSVGDSNKAVNTSYVRPVLAF